MLITILAAIGERRGRRRARRGREQRAPHAGNGDEAALARRFASGDETAIRDLYARYGRPIHTVAYATLRDPQLAAEAVQVTFLKAWRAAASYDPARPLAPWLYSIARRAAIDVARSERRHVSRELGDTDAVAPAPNIEHTWDAWQVRRAVDMLEDGEREIVRLQYFEQFTHDEIARRLGIPLGTVKSRSHRARHRLVAALAHLQEVEA